MVKVFLQYLAQVVFQGGDGSKDTLREFPSEFFEEALHRAQSSGQAVGSGSK